MGSTRCQSKNQVFQSHFFFKVKQRSQLRLNLQYKACRVLYKIVEAFSFFSTLANFHLRISHPYLLTKLSLQSPPTLPSSTSLPFFTSLFLYTTIPIIPTKNPFPYLSHSTKWSTNISSIALNFTALKVSKYRVISGLYFPVFGLNTNTGKYGPEIIPYLDTFHAVLVVNCYFWISNPHKYHI